MLLPSVIRSLRKRLPAAATAAATAAAVVSARTSFVDRQSTAVQVRVVQCRNSCLTLIIRRHFDESKTP